MAAAQSRYALTPIVTAISVMYPSTIPRVADYKTPNNRPQQRQPAKGSGSKGTTTVKTKTIFEAQTADGEGIPEEQPQEEAELASEMHGEYA